MGWNLLEVGFCFGIGCDIYDMFVLKFMVFGSVLVWVLYIVEFGVVFYCGCFGYVCSLKMDFG